MNFVAYIPLTPSDIEAMLRVIGVNSVDDLFSDIPEEMRFEGTLALPKALTEPELLRHCQRLAEQNQDVEKVVSFLGAGIYEHYVPAVVEHLVGRSEFYTAYTPYQAEVSQGVLQAIYEFQTMICQLTGMDVANASVYDAGTALVEAVNIARSTTRRDRVIFAETMHPDHLAVNRTYADFQGWTLSYGASADGVCDLEVLDVDENTAAVVVQQPNFFGCLEDLEAIAEVAHAKGALLIVCADPISLGILKAPGECGADIVVGEGQSLGNPMSYGGPTLGLFAAKEKYLRKLPGRIVGRTHDEKGNIGYVLTLQAREQHIRRQRASSNICSNQALNALAATIYLAVMGPYGLRDVASQCVQKAHYLAHRLASEGIGELVFASPFAYEFAFRPKIGVAAAVKRAQDAGYIAGLPLDGRYGMPETVGEQVKGSLLICVTETKTKADLDGLVECWGGLR